MLHLLPTCSKGTHFHGAYLAQRRGVGLALEFVGVDGSNVGSKIPLLIGLLVRFTQGTDGNGGMGLSLMITMDHSLLPY